LRVDVHSGEGKGEEKVEVWGTFRGNEWSNKGEVYEVREVSKEGVDGKSGKVWGFEGKVAAPKEYLMERSGCEYPSSRSVLGKDIGLQADL
jgi:hypothetical protein